MDFDFDKIISRSNTSALKYDDRPIVFGDGEVIPLWVADMDFAVPDAVQKALAVRAEHPIFGYTLFPETMYRALIDWMEKRHGWRIKREWIVMCPGVVPALHAAILALTRPGDEVIVQPPVYAPFLAAPGIVGRKLKLNPLGFESNRYHFDLAHFERCAADGARLLILCSPHNPVGRVWRDNELRALLKICQQYQITVVADEIHADLVYPGQQHIPLGSLTDSGVKIITAVAPSKTFNIPGLGLSALIVPDDHARTAITGIFETLHVSASNPFSIVAFEAAYREGELWLEKLLGYLEGTRNLLREYLRIHLPLIKLIEPEGTYLAWLDCRAMKLNDRQLREFFVRQAGVGMSPGTIFGEQGGGFMRMNIAMPRSVIKLALENIHKAYVFSGLE